MNSYVIVVHIVRSLLRNRRIELESESPVQFFLKGFSRPPMPQKQKLQTCPLAVFPQYIGVAKQFRNSLNHRQHLVPADKRIQPRAQEAFCREPSSNPQREASLGSPVDHSRDRRQTNVINLRVRAPHSASSNRNFEFSRQVIKLRIPLQQPRNLE